MAAGSRERPPMLATGRYAYWQSYFMRYIDTRPNCKELKQCIYDGSYVMNDILVPEKPATATEEAVPPHTMTETYKNTTPEKCAYFNVEAEAIHLILTGIGDDIYFTIDACTTAKKYGQPLKDCSRKSHLTNKMSKLISSRNLLEVATMQVNVQFLQQPQPEWSRFMTVVKQTQDLDKESYHKLFDILKQYQNKVNQIRAEKLVRNANLLALVATAQHYPEYHNQVPKPHKSIAYPLKQTTTSKSHASTRHTGKKIAKPITPPFESAFDEYSDH
ncbi:hypothetical protein Tco_0820503 [Tanacetum coccineum]|uniref:Gag-Pol polyprotein n=1 Tax=Tanacetum coccineum TaxID=301880 RepID=A0ABQ5AEC4_9ASTR